MNDTSHELQVRDQSGRVLGQRALRTRTRLLEAVAELLAHESLRELRVSDVARKAGTSPATFYQYFADAEEAVLELARQASAEMPDVTDAIEADWSGPDGLSRARALVEAFVGHWDEHAPVLRVRNLASDEGDLRFTEVRGLALGPTLSALAAKVDENQPDDDALNPRAAAAALTAILERLAAYHRELELAGVSREDLIDTSARILLRVLAPQGSAASGSG